MVPVRSALRDGPSRRRGAPTRLLRLVPLAVGAVLPVWLGGLRLALGLVVLAASAAAVHLARRARRARAAAARRAVVVEVCEALAGELRAGQPFPAAVSHCCELWPDLHPVAAAARLGADVPAALRRCAEVPGAEGLREVSSAWQVSHRSGSGLAQALAQVAVTARAREAAAGLVRGELASAQATARLVAVLPFASLTMAAGLGGRPWHFLLATAGGLGCLAGGVGCAFVGLLWIDRIAAGILRSGG
jgi:tight adherence protein B